MDVSIGTAHSANVDFEEKLSRADLGDGHVVFDLKVASL